MTDRHPAPAGRRGGPPRPRCRCCRPSSSSARSPTRSWAGGRVVGVPRRAGRARRGPGDWRCVADDAAQDLAALSTLAAGALPSLAEAHPALQLFERELAEQHGVMPLGHPWLKPVRFEPPARPGPDPWGRTLPFETIPGAYPFYAVEGEEVHEVAVGPVHAGIIEPGHFRFQCHGEEVFHLEIVARLPAPRRGGRSWPAAPPRRSAALAESIAGDTAVGPRAGPRQGAGGAGGRRGAAAGGGAAGGGAGAGAARQPRRRPRARSPATSASCPPPAPAGALRAEYLNAARRALRQPLRPRAGGARRRALRPRRRRRADRLAARIDRAWAQTAGAVRVFFRAGLGAEPDRRHRRGPARAGPAARAGRAGRARQRACRSTSAHATRSRPTGAPDRRGHPARAATCSRAPGCAGTRPSAAPPSCPAALRGPAGRPGARRASRRPRPGPAGGLAGGGLARRDLPRGRAPGPAGRFAPLQGGGPLVPQLDGARSWRCAGEQISDFPLCNKSFNLSYARARPVIGDPPRAACGSGDQTIAYPGGPARFPARFHGRPALAPGALRRRLRRLRRGLPHRGHLRLRHAGARARHGRAASSAPACQDACPEGAIAFTRRPPAGHARRGTSSQVRGDEPTLARALEAEMLRPSAARSSSARSRPGAATAARPS